jgi:glycosyltransferase involved in cell wall biosynthesis
VNIGWISQALPYLPSRGGFRLYGGNLIRQLSRRHQIHLVSLLIEDDAEHLDWARQYCASIRTIPVWRYSKLLAPLSAVYSHFQGTPLQQLRPMRGALRACATTWDVMHVEGGFAGGIVPARLPMAKVLSLHDSWTLRCAEMLKCAQSFRERLYYTLLSFSEPRYERLIYPRFERCTVVAEPDAREVRRIVPDARVGLIPYGTDTEYFHPVDVAKEPYSLVFHSHLGYAPNIEAALEFANDILPLVRRRVPRAMFHLIGANPDPKLTELASRPGIRISANLPDLRPAVCSGQVYVCAIRHGTGLKSKMLEAMGMRLPIVGYPGSVVGLSGIPGKHYLVAQTPQEFADNVVSLLEHPRRADELATAGRELVEREYSWESRARAYEELYAVVIEERRTRTTNGGVRHSVAAAQLGARLP